MTERNDNTTGGKVPPETLGLRARPQPTASTPVTWDEVAECAATGDPTRLQFAAWDVLERAAAGDLFAPLLTPAGAGVRRRR